MTHRRLAVLSLVLPAVLAACQKGPPPVLPPVPAGSGRVLTSPQEALVVREGQTVIDRVVASVNGEAILMSELEEAVILYQRESKEPTLGPSELQELQSKVLGRMIDHRLQVQEARREKVEVTEEDVRAVLDDFVRRNGGDRVQVEQQLRGQGVSWDGLRRELRDQLLAQRIRGRRVARRAHVPEPEVEAYLAENRAKLMTSLKYRVRHIAVLAEPPEQPAAWERARAEIEALAARLRDGADFATLAREHSKDPSAPAGGDLGWLTRGELEPLFEASLLRLGKGGVTEPIKSGVGYHLLRLEDQEELTPEVLGEARQQARELLLQRRAQERLDEWVESLRRRALIAVHL